VITPPPVYNLPLTPTMLKLVEALEFLGHLGLRWK